MTDPFIRNEDGLIVGFVVPADEAGAAIKEQFRQVPFGERGCFIKGCTQSASGWGSRRLNDRFAGASNCARHCRCRDVLLDGAAYVRDLGFPEEEIRQAMVELKTKGSLLGIELPEEESGDDGQADS
jgi:hypothetical protein